MATSAEHHAMNSGIPAVHVEDTTRNDDQSNPLNNLEFFKKINALLDNTLDLSALGLANITLPQGDKGLVAGQVGAQSHYDVVNNAQIPLTGIDLYNSNQTDPALTYSACNPTSYNTALATGVQTNASYNTAISSGALNNPYGNSCSGMNSVYTANQHLNNNFAPQSSAGGSAQTYNPAPGGLPQPYLAALTQLLLSGLAQQAPTHHQPPPSHPPGFVSQPQDQYSQHSQYNPYLQQQSELQSSFIPGAISNRTLEQLTESSMRPYRAIKAATDKHSYPSSESTGLTQTSNNVGTIGDRGYSGERHTSPDGKGNSRSSSPADSDSSGFSSGSDSFSDAALADLMNSLSIPTNPTQTAQTQAGLQNLQQPLQQQYQQAQQNYGQQTYNQQPPSQQYNFGQNQSLFQQQPNAFAQQAQALQSQLQQSQLQQTQLQQSQLQQNQYTAAAALAAQASAQQPQIDIMKVLGEYYLQNDALKRTQHQPMLNDFSLSAELFNPRTNVATNTLSNLLAANSNNDPHAIERAAKLYRNAATVCEPNCTWSGQLPPKVHKNPVYSCKVFLGGVPWDITEVGLQNSFKSYGSMKIEWPGKDGMHPRYIPKAKSLPAGYVYVLFESEKSVKALLQACTHDFSNGGEYYYRISSRRMRSKEVQVIPWVMSDSNFVKQASQRLDPTKTVFVGALHGMMNAEGLAHIMNDLFGNVVYAGIDTDKHKYPIGSGRVTFSSHKSYMKAVNAAFVEVKTPKFTKKIQIDPYLEDSMCQFCNIQQGPFFCRDLSCFRYYCKSCWQCRHALDDRSHKPLMRNNKGNGSNQAMVTSV